MRCTSDWVLQPQQEDKCKAHEVKRIHLLCFTLCVCHLVVMLRVCTVLRIRCTACLFYRTSEKFQQDTTDSLLQFGDVLVVDVRKAQHLPEIAGFSKIVFVIV